MSYVHDGLAWNITTPAGGYTKGTPVALDAGTGGMVVVPQETTAEGVLCGCAVVGVHYFNIAETAETWAIGEKVYLTAGGAITNVAGSNTPMGRAERAKAAGTACYVQINIGT